MGVYLNHLSAGLICECSTGSYRLTGGFESGTYILSVCLSVCLCYRSISTSKLVWGHTLLSYTCYCADGTINSTHLIIATSFSPILLRYHDMTQEIQESNIEYSLYIPQKWNDKEYSGIQYGRVTWDEGGIYISRFETCRTQ